MAMDPPKKFLSCILQAAEQWEMRRLRAKMVDGTGIKGSKISRYWSGFGLWWSWMAENDPY